MQGGFSQTGSYRHLPPIPRRSQRSDSRTIADEGVGIAKENVTRVFDAFFTTKELRGTGVGLWLSSTIVQEHGGRIQLKTRVQSDRTGTTISVLLPVKRQSSTGE